MNAPCPVCAYSPLDRDDEWMALDALQRARLNVADRESRAEHTLHLQGLQRVDKYMAGASWWCTSCGCEPKRLDSYGDCVDCGEEVWRVIAVAAALPEDGKQ